MKKYTILLSVSFAFFVSRTTLAQATAQNWTKTDCNNNTHTLFNYLDAGKIVVMEFGMGCSTCWIAGQNLSQINTQFSGTNPGKVLFFYMDYQVISCVQVGNFINLNNINFPGIASCAAEKNYYFNISPMPGVVVVGGLAHSVYYKDTAYIPADSTDIINAINNAINDPAGINDNNLNHDTFVFPNPTSGLLNIKTNSPKQSIISIYNILGERIYYSKNENDILTIDMGDICAQGIYFVSVEVDNTIEVHKLTVRNN